MGLTRHIILVCLLHQTFILLVSSSNPQAANPPPNFKDILQRAANVSAQTSIDDTLKKLTNQQIFSDESFKTGLIEIGIVHRPTLQKLSSLVLKDGSMAFDLKATAKQLAEKSGASSPDLLKIIIDAIKISNNGDNIDFQALSANPAIKALNLPVPYSVLAALINIEGAVKSIAVKDFVSAYLVSYSDSQKAAITNYIDYNELICQLKIENLAKNPIVKPMLATFGVPKQLVDILASIDSVKLTKAVDFDKIVSGVMKYTNGNKTNAETMKLIKTMLGNIDYKELTDMFNMNQLIDIALNQSMIVAKLKELGVSPTFLKSLLDDIKINDFLKVVNIGQLLTFNGTLMQLPKFILDKVDLNNILPDFKLGAILKIPQIAKILNQINLDPKLVQTIIESVDLNKFFKAFDFANLIMDLRTNTDQDYIKILLNNTNVDRLIESIDVDKLFSHPDVAKYVQEKFNMDPMIAKILLKNLKVDQLLKAIDTKALSKTLVNSVNGTLQSLLEKGLKFVNFDQIIESVNIKQFLENDKVKQMLKGYGINPVMLEVVAALDLDGILKSIKIDTIIKQAIRSGNFNTKDLLQEVMKKVDFKKILGKIDWMKIFEGASKGKMTGLPVSLECAAELGKIALATNTSGQGMMKMMQNPVVKMFDAWGKPQSRIASGNVFWLGAYDECKTIDSAKFCISKISISKTVPLFHGSCIPKKCSANDFKVMLDFGILIAAQTLSNFKINVPTKAIQLEDITCEKEDTYSTGFTMTLVVSSILVVLAIFGTFLDYMNRQSSLTLDNTKTHEQGNDKNFEFQNMSTSTSETTLYRDDEEHKDEEKQHTINKSHPLKEFLLCFSIPRNIKAIMTTSSPKGAIKSLNGIRVISITWVIIGHMYIVMLTFPIDNGLEAKKLIHRYAFLPILNGHVSVDTFFLLSGLLVSYLTLKHMNKNDGKISLPLFYLHRFLRLTPVYMYAVLVWTNVVPHFVRGPFKILAMGNSYEESCQKYWWTNLLYINNFYPQKMEDTCMAWTWYLANDMQFYMLAPLILIAMHRLQSRFATKSSIMVPFVFIGVLCLVSMLISAILIGVYDLPMVNSETLVEGNPRTKNGGTDSTYTKPYTRIVPYLIGLLVGYVFTENISHNGHSKRKFINFIGWVVAILVGYLIVYGPAKTYKDPPTFFTDGEELMYGTFSRLLWSLAVAWVIFACHNKAGGPVNALLSWSGWVPLGRLSYGAYLVHHFSAVHFVGSFENPLHYQDTTWAYYIIAVVVTSFAASFVMAVFVEVPIMNLEKMVFGKKNSKEKSSTEKKL